MSRAQAIIEAVVKNPGLTTREVGDALGLHWASAVNVVCSQLLQLVQAGKLRREGSFKNYRYYPTKLSLVDKRFGPRQGRDAAPKRRRPALKAATGAAKRYASPLAREPKPASKIAIGVHAPKPPPPPRAAAHPAGAFETVDEFLARGGKVQRLPNGASAHPLHTITPAEINERNWQRKQRAIDDL